MENSLLTALYPIHPKLVHFPIALIISAMGVQAFGFILNKESLVRAAWLMFMLAVITIPIVVLSGLSEADRLHLHHPVLTAHKNYAFAGMWLSLAALPILWFMRIKGNRFFSVLFLIILLMISTLVGLAAHQGGRMVYEYGVGVSQ